MTNGTGLVNVKTAVCEQVLCRQLCFLREKRLLNRVFTQFSCGNCAIFDEKQFNCVEHMEINRGKWILMRKVEYFC